jgi:hypothetical protein
MLLTSRKLLQRKLLDVESNLRGTLRNFSLKVGVVGGSRYGTAYSRRKTWLKAWGVRVARRLGMRRAIIVVARRLAVGQHRGSCGCLKLSRRIQG